MKPFRPDNIACHQQYLKYFMTDRSILVDEKSYVAKKKKKKNQMPTSDKWLNMCLYLEKLLLDHW